MNKLNILGLFLVALFALINCNQTSKKNDDKVAQKETLSYIDSNFESFKTKFKPLALDNLKELDEKFNNQYLAYDDTSLEVSQVHKEKYLKNLNSKYIYYGFKTELPNKSVILTFLMHYGAENSKDGEVIDTSFFVSLVFSDSGMLQSNFRSFGSNHTGEPPTYNMKSTFVNESDRLIITNYEYSIGKNNYEAKPITGSDSIYLADLTLTKYYLNYNSNEVILINKSRSKAKVVEHYRNPFPVYLRPLE
jgi:hypothetical protein